MTKPRRWERYVDSHHLPPYPGHETYKNTKTKAIEVLELVAENPIAV